MCRNFEITALNVSKWKCLSQRIIPILLFFQDLRRERKEGEREMGGQVRHQVWLSGVVSFNCRLEVVGEVGEVYFLTLNILCINANNNYLG